MMSLPSCITHVLIYAFIQDVIQNGAKGYLLKNNDPEHIRNAIISVYNGHNVLQDAVLDKLKAGLMSGKSKDKEEGEKSTAAYLPIGNLRLCHSLPKGCRIGKYLIDCLYPKERSPITSHPS